ncbi:MAG: lysine--tRNA ligase [Candidatus Omnitrophica bacterium]|nr:lysine--tRNA ligase [Candidatus Omnitrophota bacterium]
MNNYFKLEKIVKEVGNPYEETHFPKEGYIREILDNFQEERFVSLGGRLIAKREHGKSIFGHIADISAKIQIYARLDISSFSYELLKELDIGDMVGIKGNLFKTKTGEITVLVKELKLLAKSLRTLPEKWHGLKDVETKYRQRYIDLIANLSTREVFLKRAKIINFIRDFFNQNGYIEVETPILHPIPGGASGKPFVTHHNATDSDVYLRIAPELYLKRLIVGGFDKVYEIGKSFRNEGISIKHSPEFTMLEAYCAYKDYNYMMELCEELFSKLVKEFNHGSLLLNCQSRRIDFTPPWPRVSFSQLFKDEFGVLPDDEQSMVLDKICKKLNLSLSELSRSQIINITEDLIERYYPQDKPTFVTDFFNWTSPLAKTKKDNPYLLERFELFIGGIEVANSYSELNDPIEQRKRFGEQIKLEEDSGKIDEDFLLSLEYGMPPTAGLGIGIDRLIMILLNQSSIRDVILFPLLKPLPNDS